MDQDFLAPHLAEFTSLTSADIEVYSNANIYSFDKYIETIPLLNKLVLNMRSFTPGQGAFQDLLAPFDQGDKLDLSSINPRVKHFSGEHIIYLDLSVLCFMHKFPQLKTLYLNLNMGLSG